MSEINLRDDPSRRFRTIVQDGHWGWSSWPIWAGVGAVVLGATLGGGGLGSLWKRRVGSLEAGDRAAAGAVGPQIRMLSLVITALPVLAILAMVHKWHAAGRAPGRS